MVIETFTNNFQKPGLPNGKPEGSIDLKGAKVEFGNKEKSSKKNVIQVISS